MLVNIILILFIWNLIGALILVLWIGGCCKEIRECPNSDFFSPVWLYNHYSVNWFGATMFCLFLNALCPAWSIGFWFYTLCTVGRK